MVNYKEKIYLTSRGLEKLKKEYERLLEMRKSREGDPDDLVLINQRLEELDSILKTYELIKTPPKNKQKRVQLGATVVVEIDGETDEFTIVGTFEVDPSKKKISNESPIGQALFGKKVGQLALIKTPIVNHKCRIIKINYQNE